MARLTTILSPATQAPTSPLCPSHLPWLDRIDSCTVVAATAVVSRAASPILPITSATSLSGRSRNPAEMGLGINVCWLLKLLTPQAVKPLFAVIAGLTEVSLFTKVTGLLSIPATVLCCIPSDVL